MKNTNPERKRAEGELLSRAAFDKAWNTWLPCALIILFSLLCYLPCLKSGLLADDYLNLQLLDRYPVLCLIQGFQGRQMGFALMGEHYRPFFVLCCLYDHLLCGVDPFKLHLSNLFWHIAAACFSNLFAYCLLKELKLPNFRLLAFWTALLFALHPFHSEPLNWWIAKADIVYSAFLFLSMLLFIVSRKRSASPFRICSLCLFVAALASKESACIMPVLVFVLSFCLERAQNGIALKSVCKTALAESCPYFVVLVLFALIRFIALNTLIGGYSDLLSMQSLQSSVARIFSFRLVPALFLPVENQGFAAAGPEAFVAIFISLIYALAFFLLFLKPQTKERFIRMLLAIFMLAVSCFPLFLIWDPAEAFLKSRLLYFPAFTLTLFTVFLFDAAYRRARYLSLAAILLATVYFSSAQRQNENWQGACRYSDDLIAALKTAMDQIPAGNKLLLFDPPFRYKNVRLSTCGLHLRSALSLPFALKDSGRRLFCVQPEFFGKDGSINLTNLRYFAGDPACTIFCYHNPHSSKSKNGEAGRGSHACVTEELEALRQLKPVAALELNPLLKSELKSYRVYALRLDKPAFAPNYQFLRLDLLPPLEPEKAAKVDFELKRVGFSFYSKYFEQNQIYEPLLRLYPRQNQIYLHLGERANWLSSGFVDSLTLRLPTELQLDKAVLLSDKELLPQLVFAEKTDALDNDSFLENESNKFEIGYDLRAIPEADSAILELSKSDLSGFAEFRSSKPDFSSSSLRMALPGLVGQVNLKEYILKGKFRQARFFAVSKNAKILGFSSDPVYLAPSDQFSSSFEAGAMKRTKKKRQKASETEQELKQE